MPSPEQSQIIAETVRIARADADVEALWLSGSLGAGRGDAYSDVDFLALARDGALAALGPRLAAALTAAFHPVHTQTLFGRVLNFITPEWARFDVHLIEAAELGRFDPARLTPLFNLGDRAPTGEPGAYRPDPQAVTRIATEFLRVLGLSVVGFGRGEYEVLVTGAHLLRGLTMDLFLEENGVSPAARGGALSRNALVTSDQLAALASLPPVAANHEALRANFRAVAAVFLPRARRLAAQTGAVWPGAFEAATRQHLSRHLAFAF
jgi:hypothetical protein